MTNAEDSVISGSYAHLLLRLTRGLGIADAEMLEDTGIDPVLLEGGGKPLNLQQFVRLVANVQARLADPSFAVRYGVSMSVGTHGMLGFALMTSATGRDAFDLALRYHKTVFSILTIHEESDDDTVRLVFDIDVDIPAVEPLMIEGILSGILSVSRFVMGMTTLPCTLTFRHPEPEHAALYQELFGITPRFGAERNEVSVPREFMLRPLPAHDPQARKMAEEQCEKALAAMDRFDSLPKRIKKILKANPEAFPTLAEMASHLNMHPRTLGRRLSDFDTCFKDLVDEVKTELAMQYLADPNLLIDDIAYSLNYNDATSFYRAFKRWTGQSPGNYRPRGRAFR